MYVPMYVWMDEQNLTRHHWQCSVFFILWFLHEPQYRTRPKAIFVAFWCIVAVDAVTHFKQFFILYLSRDMTKPTK